ncbi:MAG: hypothetical protein JWQ43_2500 [Glaciihabitans sp.]|nr:hypothetical protein [Glaciihabitans sp.]
MFAGSVLTAGVLSTRVLTTIVLSTIGLAGCVGAPETRNPPVTNIPLAPTNPVPPIEAGRYPLHTNISATTFWVGEIFDASADDGSQELSTYDANWIRNYGGCDGVLVDGECRTERRTAENGYFPTSMTPRQNPFYLDLPYDDINNRKGFTLRDTVIPWAGEAPYAEHSGDPEFSFMKNRWVQLFRGKLVCFGQVQDAGPARYSDHRYVFGTDDRRPKNKKWDGAGLDVSPAINSCLNFSELDETERVHWRFVDDIDVPDGPWKVIVTTSGVQ